jgi:hypothetical protein
VKLIASMSYRMRFFFNREMYFMPARSICVLLKINFHALYAFSGYFMFLFLVFYKFLEPNRSFTLKMDRMLMTVYWCQVAMSMILLLSVVYKAKVRSNMTLHMLVR